jgi:hypothetical protein
MGKILSEDTVVQICAAEQLGGAYDHWLLKKLIFTKEGANF